MSIALSLVTRGHQCGSMGITTRGFECNPHSDMMVCIFAEAWDGQAMLVSTKQNASLLATEQKATVTRHLVDTEADCVFGNAVLILPDC